MITDKTSPSDDSIENADSIGTAVSLRQDIAVIHFAYLIFLLYHAPCRFSSIYELSLNK